MNIISSAAVDCPACNASAASAMSIATVTAYGLDVVSSCCGFQIWQGSVIDRGVEISRTAILGRIRAVLPTMTEENAFREPWDHDLVLGLIPASRLSTVDPQGEAHPAPITSVTIRFARQRGKAGAR